MVDERKGLAMDCFNHIDVAAVGVCKACGKALCADCVTEVEGGIVCRDSCESKLSAAPAQMVFAYRGVRKTSSVKILGLPLYDIAMGPDPKKGTMRGHARGIIAIGDTARGALAIGGAAFGVIAIGGVALGALALGGLAVGGVALGGGAIGGIAVGGGAVGGVAVGGGAAGYYAVGGGAYGKHVIDATRQSPEAIEFFEHWIPCLKPFLRRFL